MLEAIFIFKKYKNVYNVYVKNCPSICKNIINRLCNEMFDYMETWRFLILPTITSNYVGTKFPFQEEDAN